MNATRMPTCIISFSAVITIVAAAFAQPQKSWTTTQEFAQGQFINLNASTTADQLQINTWSDTKASDPAVLPYLWVACSARSTVVRIATSTFDPLTRQGVSLGQILGQYYTAPSGCRATGNPDTGPSRTTVDFDGNVWVANRNNVNFPSAGHVVKIGSGLAFQWIDRDNDTILDTSTGLTTLAWNNADGNCDASDVSGAEDELILLYRPVPATGTRTIAVDRQNNVWVGGSGNRGHGRPALFISIAEARCAYSNSRPHRIPAGGTPTTRR